MVLWRQLRLHRTVPDFCALFGLILFLPFLNVFEELLDDDFDPFEIFEGSNTLIEEVTNQTLEKLSQMEKIQKINPQHFDENGLNRDYPGDGDRLVDR